jgi:hypothetical protein
MEKTRKCRGCGAALKTDHRNEDRQVFCRKKGCQRLRRTLGQRLRRQRQQSKQLTAKGPTLPPRPTRRPQTASLISPPDISTEDPVIIGLISMITGSTDLDMIRATHRQLWIRGTHILTGRQPEDDVNSQVISFLQGIQQAATQDQ